MQTRSVTIKEQLSPFLYGFGIASLWTIFFHPIMCLKDYFIMVPFFDMMTWNQVSPFSGKFSVDWTLLHLSRSFIFGKNQLSLYQTTSLHSWPSAYCFFLGVIPQKPRSFKYLFSVYKEIFFMIPCLSLTLEHARNFTIFPAVISFQSSCR